MIDERQPGMTQDTFAAEYQMMITRAEAGAGVVRTLRFYTADGSQCMLDVSIPAGSVTGTRVRVLGDRNQFQNEIVAVVIVLPHQRWETRGDDLILHFQIDRPSAIREGTLHVAIGNGHTIAVPVNGRENHSRYIYAGYGMPRTYSTRRNGNLIVELDLIDLDAPASDLSNGERSWWRSLFGK